MNYSEFKSDVIRRAKEHSACREEFEKALKAETFAELFDVVKSNFFWCCSNKIITPETLTEVLDEATPMTYATAKTLTSWAW